MAVTDDPALMRLLTKVYEKKGWDFSQHRESTLLRRLHLRLHKYNISSFDEYIRILDSHPQEFNELINSLAINVTEFFRNPEMFEALNSVVIPRVVASKRRHQHKIIKAWSCGCSSGDEPYSLAMLFLEKLGSAKDKFSLTIIGSDIDKNALDEARDMFYSNARLKAIDKNLLERYFEKADSDKFRLKSTVRGLIRFKHHDVIKGAPFLHCDIILCRNLLIYFNKRLQEEVLLKFYESLNPGGFLILGMVESLVGASLNAFENIDNRLRIYRRPTEPFLQYDKSEMLSQEKINVIVNEMLGKE